jgi:V8-like Glu-specific endopeptidase
MATHSYEGLRGFWAGTVGVALVAVLAVAAVFVSPAIVEAEGGNAASAAGGSAEVALEKAPPDHDQCASATVINAVPFTDTVDTTEATIAASDPSQSCTLEYGTDQNSNSVWYVYEPTCDGTITISTCDSDYDTVVAVYSGTCGSFDEMGCNDDAANASCGLRSNLRGVSVSAGEPVYIMVADYDDEAGGGMLDISVDVVCTAPPGVPSNPSPADGATAVPTSTTLSWYVGSNARRSTRNVIYGDDNRLDEFEVTNADWLELGDSTVAFINAYALEDNGDGTLTIVSTSTLQSGYDTCPSEPFSDQPNPASCSGFLVTSDTIATAGHCVEDDADCSSLAFVFGFVMQDADTAALTVDASEVYYCGDLIEKREGNTDWALIQLDRPVTNHTPLQVRTSGTVPDEEPLLVIGHPSGLPRKYAGGANVRDNFGTTSFVANLDTYGGNSGSPVFSTATMMVEGILVSGETDFVLDGGCYVSNTCPDNGCSGETVTRSTEFSSLLTQFEYDVYFGEADSVDYVGTTDTSFWELEDLDLATGVLLAGSRPWRRPGRYRRAHLVLHDRDHRTGAGRLGGQPRLRWRRHGTHLRCLEPGGQHVVVYG